jgi:hypothetical protein
MPDDYTNQELNNIITAKYGCIDGYLIRQGVIGSKRNLWTSRHSLEEESGTSGRAGD